MFYNDLKFKYIVLANRSLTKTNDTGTVEAVRTTTEKFFYSSCTIMAAFKLSFPSL